jgi:hypothetical protein
MSLQTEKVPLRPSLMDGSRLTSGNIIVAFLSTEKKEHKLSARKKGHA